MSTTTVGVYIATLPYQRLDTNISSEGLGEAALLALANCQVGVPHPHPNWDPVFRPVLDLAGVRTWAAFMRGVPSIDVVSDGEHLRFDPSKNAGARRGYIESSSPSIEILQSSSAQLIGETVRAAIALCE
jgi:hypothetical protein